MEHEETHDIKPEKKGLGKKKLTLLRARLAQERTLIAWVRTGATFMTFGFAIYKLLEERVRESQVHPILDIITPKLIGVTMFITGLVGLAAATARYIHNMSLLRKDGRKAYFNIVLFQSYMIMALLIMLLIGALINS